MRDTILQVNTRVPHAEKWVNIHAVHHSRSTEGCDIGVCFPVCGGHKNTQRFHSNLNRHNPSAAAEHVILKLESKRDKTQKTEELKIQYGSIVASVFVDVAPI